MAKSPFLCLTAAANDKPMLVDATDINVVRRAEDAVFGNDGVTHIFFKSWEYNEYVAVTEPVDDIEKLIMAYYESQ